MRRTKGWLATWSLLGASWLGCTDAAAPVETTDAGTATPDASLASSVRIESGPADGTTDAYARFELSSSVAAPLECALDDAAFAACESPLVLFPLDVGRHVLRARVVGEEAAAEHAWEIRSVFEAMPSELVAPTTELPSRTPEGGWNGIFRIGCDRSHVDYDDPIVFPGMDGRAHLHAFYGNTLADFASDTESLFTLGEGTCQGGRLNRSAYWVPALLAPQSEAEGGYVVVETLPSDAPGRGMEHELFYYSAGIADRAAVQPIPLGLRMLAGDATTGADGEQSSSIARWHCQSWRSSDGANPRWSASIPECAVGDMVRFDLFFPSCWNGVDLDAEDHRSHMAYPERQACPTSHPVPLLRVSFHYGFLVTEALADPTTGTSRGWRLASDGYDTDVSDGGRSLHGDWWNAWHPEALEAITEHCVRGGLDCHDGNLANGFVLAEGADGSGFVAPIVDAGRGSHAH